MSGPVPLTASGSEPPQEPRNNANIAKPSNRKAARARKAAKKRVAKLTKKMEQMVVDCNPEENANSESAEGSMLAGSGETAISKLEDIKLDALKIRAENSTPADVDFTPNDAVYAGCAVMPEDYRSPIYYTMPADNAKIDEDIEMPLASTSSGMPHGSTYELPELQNSGTVKVLKRRKRRNRKTPKTPKPSAATEEMPIQRSVSSSVPSPMPPPMPKAIDANQDESQAKQHVAGCNTVEPPKEETQAVGGNINPEERSFSPRTRLFRQIDGTTSDEYDGSDPDTKYEEPDWGGVQDEIDLVYPYNNYYV